GGSRAGGEGGASGDVGTGAVDVAVDVAGGVAGGGGGGSHFVQSRLPVTPRLRCLDGLARATVARALSLEDRQALPRAPAGGSDDQAAINVDLRRQPQQPVRPLTLMPHGREVAVGKPFEGFGTRAE